MVKRKAKSGKKTKKGEGWLREDVAVHTSLPPQVEGQLRCYLRMSVNQILWIIPNAPDVTHVRIQWWGETSEGAIFKPLDVKHESEDTKTTARYPIRSGPKQFAAYLSDLGTLVFEVLSGPMQVPVGRASVDNIGQLNPSRPINGFFPVLSVDNEKIAELQISMALESLMASYDSTMSSVPTPDMSVDFYQQTAHADSHLQPQQRPLTAAPVPTPVQPMYLPHEDPFNSPMPSKSGPRMPSHVPQIDARTYGGANPLRDSLYSQASGGQTSAASRLTSHTSQTTLPPYPSSSASYPQSTSLPTTHPSHPSYNSTLPFHPGATTHLPSKPQPSAGLPSPVSRLRGNLTHRIATAGVIPAQQPGVISDSQGTLKGLSTLDSQLGGIIGSSAKSSKEIVQSARTSSNQVPGSSDLVSVLLERGNKLKQAMIKSTLDIPASEQTLEEFGNVFSPLKPNGSTQNLYREIARETTALAATIPGGVAGKANLAVMDSYTSAADLDERAVDMVLGGALASQQYKALNGSAASSLSLDDDQSDMGDPLHDESILNELFYRDGDEGSDLELEMYTSHAGGAHSSHTHAQRKSRARSRDNTSIHSEGNIRPASRGSRCSSMSSIILDLDEPSLDLTGTTDGKSAGGKKRKKKVRSRSASLDRKKKGGKKKTGRKSRSRSKGGGSQSDSELCSAEISRVSFDTMTTDPGDRSGRSKTSGRSSKKEEPIDGLSVQRLTLLGRVHVARVVIDKLCLEEVNSGSRDSTPVKAKSKGKPPRPAAKKSTYFVEYNFPVVASSRDKYQPNAVATEIIRVASKNVNNNIVSFGHRSVFPVLFDADAIDKWWKSALVFKLYCRNAQQKVPKLMGTCSMSLKSVLKSESLYLDRGMDVKDRSRTGSRDRSLNSSSLQDDMCPIVGSLRVHVELASDSKDFSTALAKARLAEMTHPLQIVPIVSKPRAAEKTIPTSAEVNRSAGPEKVSVETVLAQTVPTLKGLATDVSEITHLPPPSPRSARRNSTGSGPSIGKLSTEYSQPSYEPLTLHTLLMIPEGQNITEQGQMAATKHGDSNPSLMPKPASTWSGRDMRTRNLYLNCRMFWCDDAATSTVCWGTFEPKFDFSQVAPVLVTASLLERLRNNMMVVEVWDKKTSAERDQLVGIVKLPLHQFYMSFRDRKITNSLLKSQYPVIAVDGDLPILNPFNGQAFGRLRVLLAMGSHEQIALLQNTKYGLQSGTMVPERPTHYLERQDLLHDSGNQRHPGGGLQEHIVEHQFDINIVGVKGLRLLENMIWGEADCFVQYHFPAQTQLKQQGAPDIVHAAASLKAFRTSTTLCVPDPVFNDVSRHRVTLHEGAPVQRELLNACAGAGGGPGGIPFEIWCRYYYPNVREQVIAKAQLPLARLCAMVTMQKPGQPNVQSFTLQLQSLAGQQGQDDSPRMADSELLELNVTYSSKTLATQSPVDTQAHLSRTCHTSTCISVGIVRACGLQCAAGALARHDENMLYAAEVGVNTYVRVRLSFLPKEDERITRTVARTFAPDFNFYLDFPTPLLWTEPGSDALSLAEILETAEVSFELWHQAPQTQVPDRQYMNTGSDDVTARKLSSLNGDVMMGSVNLPLIELLHKKTGINGWFPVYVPTLGWDTGEIDPLTQTGDSLQSTSGLHRVVGGLELSIKLAHAEDLARLINAAKGVGWQPDFDVDTVNWEDTDELNDMHYEVTIALDNAVFPVSNALIAGQSQLDLNTKAYLRYKFYDTGAKCSRLCSLHYVNEECVSVDVAYSKCLHVPGSSPFSWYLSEEKLEVQVWVTHHADQGSKQRPRNRDKLIGSAFIDLSALARKGRNRKPHRISNIYPLFKPGASSLGGACLRAHVSIKPLSGDGTYFNQSDDSDQEVSLYDKYSPKKRSPASKVSREEMEQSFGVHISIERAFHLPIITDDGESQAPNAYVSYQTADKRELTYSAIFPHSSNPVWNHQDNPRLSRTMLAQSAKGLVFKVWHKPTSQGSRPNKGTDKVLGFVSVDLTPLTTGFNQLCGWYNVMDFNGMCQGQIKVAITPSEPLVGSIPPIPPTQTFEGSSERFTQFLQTTSARLGTIHPASHSHTSHTQPASQTATHPHFSEHYENVKRHHEQLNHHMTETGVTDPSAASRSLLFTTLRSQMDDLDKITNTLKQRLVVNPYQYDSQSGEEQTPRSDNNQYNHHGNHAATNLHQQHHTHSNERSHHHTHHHDNRNEYQARDRNTRDETGNLHGDHAAPNQHQQQQHHTHSNEYQDSDRNTRRDQTINQPFDENAFMNAEYRRPENDSSTYSQTLRNAQGILQTADELIANMNTAVQRIGGDTGVSNQSNHASQSTHAQGSRGTHDVSTRGQDNASPHVRFDERSPQMSEELPNYSHHYTQGFSSSNTVTPHASSEPGLDRNGHSEAPHTTESNAQESGDWEGLDGGAQLGDTGNYEAMDGNYGDSAWQRYSDQESDDEEAQVIMAKPLNDVSSANFANYASLHEDQLRQHAPPPTRPSAAALHDHSVIEEQDSWFSAPNANASRVDELYDTINSAAGDTGVDGMMGGVATSEIHGNFRESSGNSGNIREPSGSAAEAPVQMVETQEELMQYLADEDPTALRTVSRVTTVQTEKVSFNQSARKAGEYRRDYLHHRHSNGGHSSDSNDDEQDERPKYPKRSKSKSGSSQNEAGEMKSSSAESSEPMQPANPMLRTQKTINISWDKKSRTLLDVAQGFNFEEGDGEEEVEEIREESGSQRSSVRSYTLERNGASNEQDNDRGEETPTYQSDFEADDPGSNQNGDDSQDHVTAFEPPASGSEAEDDIQTQIDTIHGDGVEKFFSEQNPLTDTIQLDHSNEEQSDRSAIHSARSEAHSEARSHGSGISGAHSERSSVRNQNGNNNGHAKFSDTSRDLLEVSHDVTPRDEPCTSRAGNDRTASGHSKVATMPSFFPPATDMASTMKALRLATHTAKHNTQLEAEKAKAKRKVLESLSVTAKLQPGHVVSAKSRPLPTSQQANRIARIFQQKFS